MFPLPFARFLYLGLLLLSTTLSQYVLAQSSSQCSRSDIDLDNDGLIEICDLEGLDAVRYQLDGSGYRESRTADKITAGCPRRGCSGYELRRDLSFNAAESYRDIANKDVWTKGVGWQPIGDPVNAFGARFEGNGHSIADLFIDSVADYIGLFRKTGEFAKINRLILLRVDIKGGSFSGSLVGSNAGIISNIDVEGGRLTGSANHIGGLVGANKGTILNADAILEKITGGVAQMRCREDLRSSHCRSSERIEVIVGNGIDSGVGVGGLVGYNEGRISDSHAGVDLLGRNRVGGLVGFNSGEVLKGNRASGTIRGRDYSGGLVGFNNGYIGESYADSDAICSGAYCGGLVGVNSAVGRIIDSYASGDVAGGDYVGGLVGGNEHRIGNSFAIGRVDGEVNVGGLVGGNESGLITNTYARVSVTGVDRIGGLVGRNEGTVSDSLAVGSVVGRGADVGGLIGWNYAKRTRHALAWVANSYWDSEVGKIGVSDGGSSRTTAQLKSATESGAVGETFEGWSGDDWDFGTNEQYPMLKHAVGYKRGHLLSERYTELSDLRLPNGIRLFPPFDTKLFDYRAEVSAYSRRIIIRPIAMDDSSDISIAADSGVSIVVGSNVASPIRLREAPQATIITIGQRYRLRVIRPLATVSIDTNFQDGRVAEGQRLRLKATTSGSESSLLRYWWTQVSPRRPSLLKGLDNRQSELDIIVPPDFVTRNATATVVELRVKVNAGKKTLVGKTTIKIIKTNNGRIASLATLRNADGVLSVSGIGAADLSEDPDGEGEIQSMRYRWQSKPYGEAGMWRDIKGASGRDYKLPIGSGYRGIVDYRVRVAYRDRQGYVDHVLSEALSIVASDYDNDGLTDINYIEDLAAVRLHPDDHYELTRDLDFNAVGSYRNLRNKLLWTVNDYDISADSGWLPLATTENPFTGRIEGNGYTILNLQINRDNADNQGLFGVVAPGAVINDIGLLNVNIEGGAGVGGLAANNGGTISNSYVVGKLRAARTAGGLVAHNSTTARIINSYAYGTVSSDSDRAGGLVGNNEGLISNSYAGSRVDSAMNYGGGLAAVNTGGAIKNSYATGDVSGNRTLGGLVGFNDGTVSDSYSLGRVVGSNMDVGGLVGRNNGEIDNSYWNVETSMAQGNNGEGHSSRQLQLPTAAIGLYRDWSDRDWDFGTNKQYPTLKYTSRAAADVCVAPCGNLISPGLRYGLRSMTAVNGVLFPAFDIGEQNRSGVYAGTLSNTTDTLQLTATAMEATAHIGFYIDDNEVAYDEIRSGGTSKAIALNEHGLTRVIVEVKGTRTVRYKLYLNYRATNSEGAIFINYIEDLDAIRNRLGGHYKLARDLDFKDDASYRDAFNKVDWTVYNYEAEEDRGWTAIGNAHNDSCSTTNAECFHGVFDGNGYTLSNLQINRNAGNQALFGGVDAMGVITDVGLSDVAVAGGRNSGGLVAVNEGKVERSYVTGNIRYIGESRNLASVVGGVAAYNRGRIVGSYAVVEVAGYHSVGGLVGRNDEGFIINSFADGVVSAETYAAGGLVGNNEGTIIHSHATSEIEAKTGLSIGGLVGVNSKRIIASYAHGTVKGQIYVGGLVGSNSGSIDDSYARGAVIGQSSVGGLVGRIDGGDIAESYATGEVKGRGTTVGGLVGSGSGSVVASYWDKTINDDFSDSDGFARTTLRLQSARAQQTSATMIYYRWSNTNWDFGTNKQYPILKYADYSALGRATCAATTSTVVSLPRCGALLSPELRHGLSELRTTNDTRLSPPFDVSRHNQNSVYFGRALGNTPSIRLIATAMETTARINIYVGTTEAVIDRNLASGSESSDIALSQNGITRITIEVEGSETVRHTLHIRYVGADADGDGLIEINDLEDLNAIRFRDSDLGYELVGNLDFKDDQSYRDLSDKAKWTVDDYADSTDSGWQPISNFNGIFEGNGYTISHLQINGDELNNQALFALLSSAAVIRNIGLLNVDIEGGENSGSLVGNNLGTIIGSYAVGELSGKDNVGGLVGVNGRHIINSYAYGVISANDRVGALVGNNEGTIINSHAGGQVSGIDNVGGLVGWSSDGEIINSYASSDIRGENGAGGLVARLEGSSIVNSYASGDVMGNRRLGGLVGYQNGTISYGYAIGRVIGVGDDVVDEGGLAGLSNAAITASYWNTETSDTQADDRFGQTTVALQSPTTTTAIYDDWSSAAWDFGTNMQYPILKYGDYSGLGHTTCAPITSDDILLPKCGDLISAGLRHGLRDLITANEAIFSPPFDIARQNQIGVYVGTIIGPSNVIRLIATAMESTATISIYVGKEKQSLNSGETSLPITLAKDAMNRIVIDVEGTKSSRYLIYVDYRYRAAIADADGYVEINYLEDLDAIRYQLDGSGYRRSSTANKITLGCPLGRCKGYKLTRDLDFNDVHSYRDTANMARWTGDGSWTPIASAGATFVSILKGNNKTISNLRVRADGGLFASLGADKASARIDGIGLLGVDIKGNRVAGLSADCNGCVISNSYVIGDIEGVERAAGLVGHISAVADTSIANSYFMGRVAVDKQDAIGGGLVAVIDSANRATRISDSYAIGSVTGKTESGFIGSLIGVRKSGDVEVNNSYAAVLAMKGSERWGLFGGNADPDDRVAPTVHASYSDIDIAGIPVTIGRGIDTVGLQSPTAASGIYAAWNAADWDFGTAQQYPALRYNLTTTVAGSDDACDATDTRNIPVLCGALLGHQGSLLQSLRLSAAAGFARSFDFTTFDYDVSVHADQSAIRLTPVAFNRATTIEVSADAKFVTEVLSGTLSAPIPLQAHGDTIIELVVKDGERRSYRYRLRVMRLAIVAENIDKDNDGLIDIDDVAHLDAMRYQLDGRAYREKGGAPIYCADGCIGYELTGDLDLGGAYWQPIGDRDNPFTGLFKGNGHTISNLLIEASDDDYAGLFGATDSDAVIENVGLVNVDIVGRDHVGSLVGNNHGKIISSYAIGNVNGRHIVGGLAGWNSGSIINSYADVAGIGSRSVGGLVGYSSGYIMNSYADGKIESDIGGIGGLIGGHDKSAIIGNSYAIADVITSSFLRGVGGLTPGTDLEVSNSYYRSGSVVNGNDTGGGTSRTEAILRQGVPSDDVYREWDRASWHFGNEDQYPALLYKTDDVYGRTCKMPSARQLSDCDTWLSPSLSDDDKAVICRSHLLRSAKDLPYCGALLPAQRRGLVRLDFSKNVAVFPIFNSERYDYEMIVASGAEIYTTPTAYYGGDTITMDVGDSDSSIASGRATVPITITGDLHRLIYKVKSANKRTLTRYTINVYDVTVDDGMIEIQYLEDLNIMRYPLARISAVAEDCPLDANTRARQCKGYRLTRDLDFNDPTDYRSGIVNSAWTSGLGWQPIEDFASLFAADGHTISNLRINRPDIRSVGLFAATSANARIEGLGLLSVDINGYREVGALVGSNRGEIITSYVRGGGINGNKNSIGALVGANEGIILNSHANALVHLNGNGYVGGLVGSNKSRVYNSYAGSTVNSGGFGGGLVGYNNRGAIINSYASGDVSGPITGGLVGTNQKGDIINSYASGCLSGQSGLFGGSADVEASYWDTTVSKPDDQFNNRCSKAIKGGYGKTTSELQSPMSNSGIYADWSLNDWYFGTAEQYPLLRYTTATDIVTTSTCRDREDSATHLPICGTLLSGQRAGLRNLALSKQVLLLEPAFDVGIFNYDLILKKGEDEFQMTITMFNEDENIVVVSDGLAASQQSISSGDSISSGRSALVSIADADSAMMTLTTTATTLFRYNIRISRHPFIGVNDIDLDDDGLIEVDSVAAFDAIRHQLDGSGYRSDTEATKINVGCPAVGCKGYELVRDLDLGDDSRLSDGQTMGVIVADDNTAMRCEQRGNRCFSGVLEGNGHTISNLSIDNAGQDNVALFAGLSAQARIKNLSLANVRIKGGSSVAALAVYNAGLIANSDVGGTVAGNDGIGALVAINAGKIFNSYALGVVSGNRDAGGLVARNAGSGIIKNSYALNDVLGDNGVGGLVGLNVGMIKNTYASGNVEAYAEVGGLVGINRSSIADSYASARVIATTIMRGGLVGSNSGDITNSYWDVEHSGIDDSVHGLGQTTRQLRRGLSQLSDATAAYYGWDSADWHFGTAEHYPILKYASDDKDEICDSDGQPNCGDLQFHGLANLSTVEVSTLAPKFDATRLHYKVSVELDANISDLRLIPTARNKDATIRIVSDDGFDEVVDSGTTSSAITLRATETTVIHIEVVDDRSVTYRLAVTYFSAGLEREIDSDGDELIEIRSLEDLDAMRYALDGRRYRYKESDGVFVETARGCPTTGCKGYELTRDLDFYDPQSYRTEKVNSAWTDGSGWLPIGTSARPFTAIFKGNGFTISNLKINRAYTDAGLFGVIDGRRDTARIEQLGLSDVEISGGEHVGGLVGVNRGGTISESYVTGTVQSRDANSYAAVGGLVAVNEGGIVTRCYAMVQAVGDLRHISAALSVGGLVGSNTMQGIIENSYAIGSILSRGSMGGLVAVNDESSRIINSYAVNNIVGVGSNFQIGGLLTSNQGSVSRSYWDSDVNNIKTSAGGSSQTTVVLKQSVPTSPTNSIYKTWDTNIWDFGNAHQYPMLRAVENRSLINEQQNNLLRDLILSEDVKLFPNFHPLIFNYTIMAEAEQPTPVRLRIAPPLDANATVDIRCSDEIVCTVEKSMSPPQTIVSFTVDGINTPEINIVVNETKASSLSYRFAVHYHKLEINNVTQIFRAARSSVLTVNEGERVRLKAEYNFGLADDSYRYQWQQLEDDSLKFNDVSQPVIADQSVLDFTVPADVVPKDADHSIVKLAVAVGVGNVVYASREISLIINKVNNDIGRGYKLNYSQTDTINEPYTYNIVLENSGGADADRGFAENSLTMQWQRRRNPSDVWADIGDSARYKIEGDYQYRAIATYEDGQGYSHDLEASVIDSVDIDDDNDGLIEINYLEDLNALRYQLNGSGLQMATDAAKVSTGCPASGCKGYELIRDLDFLDDTSYRDISNKNGWTTGLGWQPIGGVFRAIFRGNGYIISNLYINRPNQSDAHSSKVGLFSIIERGALVDDLVLSNVKVSARGDVGGLAGQNFGKINMAYLTVGKVSGHKNVGGLVGINYDTVINSYVEAVGNTSKIETRQDNVGGLVGSNNGGKAYITNSYARINVSTAYSGFNKLSRTGGLVGTNINGGKISNSYAAGTVKGPCRVGGLVGFNWTSSEGSMNKSVVSNSYATGEVTTGHGACSNNNIRAAGGLVGHNAHNGEAGSKIEYSYATNKIKTGVYGFNLSGSGIGGLAALQGSNAETVNSYWAVESNCTPVFTLFVCFPYNFIDNNARLRKAGLQNPTMPNTKSISCVRNNDRYECTTYKNWNTAHWDFGTTAQYPALKYGVGLDTNNPACGMSGLPNCGLLLPGESVKALLLKGISVSANSLDIPLSPSFIPNRFSYDISVQSKVVPATIKIVPNVGNNAVITITEDNESLVQNSDGSVEFKMKNLQTQVSIQTKPRSGNARGATYQLQIHLEYPPQIKLSSTINEAEPEILNEKDIVALNEGDTITLNSTNTLVRNDKLLIYKWSQISGHRPLTEVISESPYIAKYTVPLNFIAEDKSDSTIVLKLDLYEADNPMLAASREIPLSVSKINNGDLTVAAKWISNDTLSVSDVSKDPDGGPITNISYVWSIERDGEFQTIADARQQSYTPAEDARNERYRLSITYTDGQGYRVTRRYDAPRYETTANREDKDGDGLIEIENLEDLNAIRYQPDGNGYRADASVTTATTIGCPIPQGDTVAKCHGYELTRDLDFRDDASYASTSNKTIWTSRAGWQPIGDLNNPFKGVFEGNGYTISNLRIRRARDNIGLFGYVKGNKAELSRVGLRDVFVEGNNAVGGLVGKFEGKSIAWSYVSGKVTGSEEQVGGLVGEFKGDIESSYAIGDVMGRGRVGGLVGYISDISRIKNSYTSGNVVLTEDLGGGLVGYINAENISIVNTYTDSNVSGRFWIGGLVGVIEGNLTTKNNRISDSLARGDVMSTNSDNGLISFGTIEINRSYWRRDNGNPIDSYNTSSENPNYKGFTSEDLQSPTRAGTRVGEPYYNWSNQHWSFGTSEQYPALKYYDDTCDTPYPSSDCGKLLLYQRIGLKDIRLEQDDGLKVQLFPNFHSTRTSYTVTVDSDADALRLTPIATNPDARIVAGGKVLTVDTPSYLIPLDTAGPISTVIQVSAQNSLFNEEPIIYTVTINNRFPSVTMRATPALIYEDDVARLDASVVDRDGDKLHYRLTATADILSELKASSGEFVGRGDLSFAINIPEDLIDAKQSRRVVEIALTVDDGLASVTEKVPLTIIKENNGVVSIPTPMRQGFVYTIPAIDLSAEVDGIASSSEFSYQWQRESLDGWVNIEGSINPSYVVTGVLGEHYRVVVDYTDKQGYEHQGLASEPVAAPMQFIFSAAVVELPVIFTHLRIYLEGLLP